MTIKVSVEMGPLNGNQKKWPPNCAIRKIVVIVYEIQYVYVGLRLRVQVGARSCAND